MFQACLVGIPSQVVCFENHAEWRFCLASFCVSRLVGAVALGWRSGARVRCCFLLCSRLVSCTCALLWMFILTHATALKSFHSKQSYPLHHLQQNESSIDVHGNNTNEMTTIPEITTEELRTAIDKLREGKSPDSNGIRAEDIKACDDETREMVRQIFNEIIKQNEFTPEAWKKVKNKSALQTRRCGNCW